MPNWKTHIKVANEVNSKLGYNNIDYELYVLGNILPDINNGYVKKDISTIYSHSYTHYKNKELSGHQYFLKLHSNDMKNSSLIMGYYIHLLTDYFFNDHFYKKISKDTKYDNYTEDNLRKIKQNDFRYYNNMISIQNVEVKNMDRLIEESKKIKNISIVESDIIKVQCKLNNIEKDNKCFPEVYNHKEFDELIKEVTKKILNIICDL